MDEKLPKISPAPHWRMLKEYGGNLDIKKFRDQFNKVDYEEHGVTNEIPKFKSIGRMYEEKLKF